MVGSFVGDVFNGLLRLLVIVVFVFICIFHIYQTQKFIKHLEGKYKLATEKNVLSSLFNMR